MTNRVQRAALTALCVAGFAVAAAAQLNPTVTVLGVPTTAVPSGCDQSIAPQAAPRVQIEEIPEPAKRKANAPPPAASLRAQLKDVQAAADRGDRSAFRDALARVKTTVSTYAAGGEKDAAGDVIRVYDDLDRIWTYQMETPTGAFFDSTSVPAQIMRNYPDFERAIADQTFTDSHGIRFYPTTETREFLVREAAERLKKLGVAVATRAPRAPRVLPTAAATAAPAKARPAEEKTAKKAAVKTAEPKAAEKGVTKRPHKAHVRIAEEEKRTAKKPSARAVSGEVATKHPSEALGSIDETRKPAAKPAVKKASGGLESPPHTSTRTTAAPKQATASVKEAKSPAAPSKEAAVTSKVVTPATSSASTSTHKTAATSTAPATTSTPPPASAPTASATTAPASTSATETTSTTPTATSASTATTPTETSASTATTPTETSASTATTDTTTSSAAKQPQSKGIILPIILIVVGIGVLIVLFRASS